MSDPHARLRICDHGEVIEIRFDDLLKYHGRSFIGGVAHGFKAMQRALPLLANGEPPDRYEISILTAFPGPGARDAFEMVTRAVTGERYTVDLECGPPGAIASARGRYFFRFTYKGTAVDLSLRDGIVRDEFIDLVRKGVSTAAEQERLNWLKQDMTDRMLALPPDQVYDASGGSPIADDSQTLAI